jgi:hypothetical protein
VEFCLVNPCGVCVLHRLLTLSLRLSMALCTNPPMPLVGDAGRSVRTGEMRPCVGDIAKARPEAASSSASCSDVDDDGNDGKANFCDSNCGKGDLAGRDGSLLVPTIDVFADRRTLPRPLSARGGEPVPKLDFESRDMPGSCLLPKAGSASATSSSLFFLSAADPTPRSGVCLNHSGDLLPRFSAI